MMFPLCTSVTDERPCFCAYSIAMRTRRLEPNSDIGLMPTAECSRMVLPSFSRRNVASCSASGVPARNSMPE